MRNIPGVVPPDAQNATALVIQDEMGRRLSRLKTAVDWGSVLEGLTVSRGTVLSVVARTLADALSKTSCIVALSLYTGSLPRLVSRRMRCSNWSKSFSILQGSRPSGRRR